MSERLPLFSRGSLESTLGPQFCMGPGASVLDHLPGTVRWADLSQPNVNNFREVAPHKGRGCKRVKKDRRFIALEYLSLLKVKWHIRGKMGLG